MIRGKRIEYWHLPKERMRKICSWHFESIELLSDVLVKKCSWPLTQDFAGLGFRGWEVPSMGPFSSCYFTFAVCTHLLKKTPLFLKYIVFCFTTLNIFEEIILNGISKKMRNCVVFVQCY